ncbi:MAG TPA: serine protease [bacterium]|nr:serine protease [bacterium]
MPTLHEIHKEMGELTIIPAQDVVRRKYLRKISEYTANSTVLYATSFSIKDIQGDVLQINRQDIQLFMSALKDVKGENLDLIIHSSGGSAEATEQIVNYLRSKFKKIRVIIPQNAMSAATMLACSADEIIMGKHSSIGPIDPQIISENYAVAAQSILSEFEMAQQSINKPGNNPILWLEKIKQYPPGLLIMCMNQIELAQKLVKDWLTKYMFKDDQNKTEKAKDISSWLGNNKELLSHGRSIGYDEARKHGLKIKLLEDDQKLQELVLSLFHATVATFQKTTCVKIVENHMGKGTYIQIQQNHS